MAAQAIKSAQRAFEILEYFDRARQPLALKDIAAQLGYPPSSGSALLKSMVSLGYLEYDQTSRTYFPTMRIAALGSWVREALFGEGEITQLMTQLHRVSGETVILATQSDLYAQYIHLMHSQEPLHFAVPPGTRRPLASSGMGWLFLSTHTDKEIERLRRRINAEPGQKTKFSRDDIMKQVNLVRVRGYAFSKGAVSRDAGIIAMLLPEGRHGRTLAIGVGGPVRRLAANEKMIVSEMREAIEKFVSHP